MRHDTTPEEARTFLSVFLETPAKRRGRTVAFNFAERPVVRHIAAAISRPLASERPTSALRAA